MTTPADTDPPPPRASSQDRPTAYETTLAASTRADLAATRDATDPGGVPTSELPAERYFLREAIGAGGMGEVRVLRDAWIGREVARKSLLRELSASGPARARFLREIRVQGQLEHPAIVPVYDVGRSEDGDLSFTMRRIDGLTLAEVIEGLARGDEALGARFSRRRLLGAFSRVCMAAHYAHSRGVVHRDLKPSNIMLGAYGEVYVLDWGIAKIAGDHPDALETDDVSTDAGRVVGTLGYMAPEQARAEGDAIDARTDVYALGVILFEILTLEHVLAGLSTKAAMAAIAAGVDARPTTRARGADLPPELETLCVRATAAAPGDRFASAEALSEAVERFLDGDRDLERRRELADGLAVEAAAAAERALAKDTPPAGAERDRTAAFRDAFRALALAPEQPTAQRTLARLILEVPEELPPAAAAERAAARREERAEGARLGFRAYASYALAVPLMMLVGVKSWLLVGAGIVLTALAALLARRVHRGGKTSTRHFVVLLTLSALVVICQGTWLGPFVLLPSAATITTSVFALYAERRERPLVLIAGAAMFLLPFLAELLGLVPRGFSFEAGRVVLHERALSFPATWTTTALLYTNLGFIVLPGLFLFRLRDALGTAEDRRFLQAWYLKQLFAATG